MISLRFGAKSSQFHSSQHNHAICHLRPHFHLARFNFSGCNAVSVSKRSSQGRAVAAAVPGCQQTTCGSITRGEGANAAVATSKSHAKQNATSYILYVIKEIASERIQCIQNRLQCTSREYLYNKMKHKQGCQRKRR